MTDRPTAETTATSDAAEGTDGRNADPAVRARRRLGAIGAVCLALSAGIHLYHPTLGAVRLLEHLRIGRLLDPRPLAFTLSGLGALAWLVLWYHDVRRGALAVAGIVLLTGYSVGYVAWHTVLAHGAFWPGVRAHGHGWALSAVPAHLAAEPLAAAAVAAQTLGTVALVGYLAVAPRRQV